MDLPTLIFHIAIKDVPHTKPVGIREARKCSRQDVSSICSIFHHRYPTPILLWYFMASQTGVRSSNADLIACDYLLNNTKNEVSFFQK